MPPISSFRPSSTIIPFNLAPLGWDAGGNYQSIVANNDILIAGDTNSYVRYDKTNVKSFSTGRNFYMLAYTGQNFVAAQNTWGMSYSSDGLSFSQATSTATRTIYISSDGAGVVVAIDAASTTAWRSTDHGVNYSTIVIPNTAITHFSGGQRAGFDPISGFHYFSTSAKGLDYSENGTTWFTWAMPGLVYFPTCIKYFDGAYYIGDTGGNIYRASSWGAAPVKIASAYDTNSVDVAGTAKANGMAVHDGRLHIAGWWGFPAVMSTSDGETWKVSTVSSDQSTTPQNNSGPICYSFNGDLYVSAGTKLMSTLRS